MSEMRMRDAIKRGLQEALDNDPRVFIMGEDIGEYGGAYAVTDGFLKKYGAERIKDTPISEASFIGCGIGAAMAGLRPVVELMSISFSLVAFDQIINMAGNIRYMSGGQVQVPLILRAPTGAGSQLAATHSQSFETWIAETPGIKCVCPSTPYDALGLLRTAFKDNNPVMFAEPAALYGVKGEVPDEHYGVPFGKAEIRREGSDVTLVGYGAGMPILAKAGDILAGNGVSAEIIDLRSLNPLDIDAVLGSVLKTNRLVGLDMARKLGGVMAEVVAEVQQRVGDFLDGPAMRVGAQNTPWPYSGVLERESLPKPEQVVAALKEGYGI